MDARGKSGEHEKCVRVARGAAESNSSFLSALQTPKCIHNSIYAQLKAWANSFITERQQRSARGSKICCSWSSDKFAKRATCEFFSALFLLLVGSGPKRSMPIEKLGSSSLVSSIFQREGKLHYSLTRRKLWSQVKKCSSHIIYARACVNKDFVHSGSIGLI